MWRLIIGYLFTRRHLLLGSKSAMHHVSNCVEGQYRLSQINASTALSNILEGYYIETHFPFIHLLTARTFSHESTVGLRGASW